MGDGLRILGESTFAVGAMETSHIGFNHPRRGRVPVAKMQISEGQSSRHWAGSFGRRERSVVQISRADRIAVNHPVVLSANSVHTKKKPWELLITTPPFEWRMIMAAPINPPNSMMMYPQI